MPKCIELLPSDWLISNLCYQAIEQVYLIKWPVSVGFQLLKSLWSSLTYFSFNDAPNVLYRWKIWTSGRQFNTQTLLQRSHAVIVAAVCGFALSCWNTQGLPWNRRRLEGSICCSKTNIYLSVFIVPSKTCKLPIPMHLCTPYQYILNEPWTTGHDGASRPCSHMASFLL